MLRKFKFTRPKRHQLSGWSRSKVKTALKQVGAKVPRDLFGWSSGVFVFKNRLCRIRWSGAETEIDISCPRADFDRWSNSTDNTVTLAEFITANKKG